jgi:hypothetical protein
MSATTRLLPINSDKVVSAFTGWKRTRIFTAFAGIRLAADAVHRQRQHGMRLGGNGTERHRAGGEAFDDAGGRLDFIERHRRAGRFDFEQAAQSQMPLALIVDQAGIFLVGLVLVGARGVLQLGDRIRRPQMIFAAHAEGILAAGFERVGQHRIDAERRLMLAQGFLGDFKQADAFDIARSAGEVGFRQKRC